MTLTRRQALGLMAGAGVGATAGCSRMVRAIEKRDQGPLDPPNASPDEVAFLNRFGYGPRPGDLASLRKTGTKRWFQDQLAAPLNDDWGIEVQLEQLEIFNYSAYELRDLPEPEIIRQLQIAAIIRAVYSPWQLRERMVDFWSNHFNIFARKGLAAYRKPEDERKVIRAHALGSFPEMLAASAKSTAMLLYLDQQASNYSQPNENYARELLELHSLGVKGGYTQKDVMEVARCFTGWTEEREFLKPIGDFKFDAALHDDKPKHILGHVIPGGLGVGDGDRVLDIIGAHPATAKHISGKLCRFFLGTDSDADQVAKTYLDTKGNIGAMLGTIRELAEKGKTKPSLKRPFDFVVSSLRALDADTDGADGVQRHIEMMGQPLYQWPMPDGYPDATEAWTGSLLGRWNFAMNLCSNRVGGTTVNVAGLSKRMKDSPALAMVFARSAHAPELKPVGSALKGLDLATQTALALASPEFQWR
jgi:uncharacterized protein (DUF1800 family)